MGNRDLSEKGDGCSGVARRRFLGLCGALGMAAASRPAAAAPALALKKFEKVRLVDDKGEPVKASGLKVGLDYIFHYPFAGTPCLLTDLGEPPENNVPLKTLAGRGYKSLAGVGPKKAIVAFSAICTHLLTHPTKNNSFVNYYHENSDFADRGKVVTCCAHGSVFDINRGGEVVTGEAKQPLLSVALEHDAKTDELFAIGVLGDHDLFHHFLTIFHLVNRFFCLTKGKIKGIGPICALFRANSL